MRKCSIEATSEFCSDVSGFRFRESCARGSSSGGAPLPDIYTRPLHATPTPTPPAGWPAVWVPRRFPRRGKTADQTAGQLNRRSDRRGFFSSRKCYCTLGTAVERPIVQRPKSSKAELEVDWSRVGTPVIYHKQ